MKAGISLAVIGVLLTGALHAASVSVTTATATAPAPPHADAAAVPFDPYSGYFVNNTFEPAKERSLVIASTPTAFDKIFGAGFVMNDKSHRLAPNTFDKNIVLAIIRRGNAPTDFTVESATLLNGTLTLKYQTKSGAAGTATFASPLILSIPRTGVTAVKFIENGIDVGTVTP